ncbi:efflux transporter outer membrane subunit [Aquirhabdus sp.]|uniref:efflux transporter outer membrane subunit n=1 Tax=Aquirhabdus sp. TaxID=2824160 RepID=UPI00396C57A3
MVMYNSPRLGYSITLLAAALSSQLLSGCAVGPDFVRPSTALPSSYTEKQINAAQSDGSQQLIGRDIPAQWWEVFHSPALNHLVTASLQHNPSIEAAQAALRESQENVEAQQSAYFPTVGAAYSGTRQKTAAVLASPLASNSYIYNLHTAQVNVSYSLDLFGVNRRQVESLKAQAESEQFQLEATYLTLTSNVVNAAILEAMLREQIRVTDEIIGTQQKLLDMAHRQFDLGQISTADVVTQEASLASAQATLPPLQKQLAIQRDLLETLAGQFPSETLDAEFTLNQLELPQQLPLTLPSTLVDHRPDIRAAEAGLHAASADIGVAIANRLPNITLGVSSYGTSASRLSDLFKSATDFWTLAGGVTQPLFDAGALKHKQGAAEASYDLAKAQYRQTVLGAFQNVADVLQAIQADTTGLQAAEKSVTAATRSAGIARQQFKFGDISTLALLVIEQNEQQAQLNMAQARANQLQDTAALFQALGGGWWNRTDSLANHVQK